MTSSNIFDQHNLQLIEANLRQLLNDCKDFDNPRIISSPRAVGDTVQEILGEKMNSCFPSHYHHIDLYNYHNRFFQLVNL